MPRRARWYIGRSVMSLLVHQNAPGIRADQADDHVERRGLAGAVRAQQAHHFALLHEDRDIVHHTAAAIGFGDLPGFESADFAHADGACTLLRPTFPSSEMRLLPGLAGSPVTSSLSSLAK